MVTIFYNWFTPAFKAGGPTQSIDNLLFHLESDLKINIICDHCDHDGTVLPVVTNSWLPYGKKSQVWYSKKGSIISWIRFLQNLQDPVSYLNGIYSFRFSVLPLFFLRSKKIICVRGMLDPGSFSKKKFKKSIFLFVWKKIMIKKIFAFHAASDLEKYNLQTHFGCTVPIYVIPNFPKLISFIPVKAKGENELRLITVSLINPIKNYLHVLRSLRYISANIRYDIYGPINDLDYWQSCIEAISLLPNNIKVVYHGVVQPNLVPFIMSEAHVYIQPSDSENFGHSLYESLLIGRPIITSNQTPWNKLENNLAGFNVDVLRLNEISDSISFFASMNFETFKNWSNASRIYAEKALNLESSKKAYLKMFLDTICGE